ncbi:MAG: hypothetical protein P8J01_06665 [Acidimicrobiales bacterium]|nr:hypothetical protein [Acidimicrobiales bacterium]
MSLALNLVALLLVVGLSWGGMMWLAGLIHRGEEPSDDNDQ